MKNIKTIFVIICSLITFYTANKISFQIRTNIATGKDITAVLDNSLADFSNPTHFSLDTPDLLAGAGTLLAIALTWIYHHAGKAERRQGEEHGSAKWGTPKDFKPFATKIENQCIKITNEHWLNINSHVTQRNLNLLCLGGSGSGKTRSLVKPNIFAKASSFVITDPKGELLRDCAWHLLDHGYKIRCLNLIDFATSDKFNPLTYFNPAQPEVDCTVLTENFIANTNGSKPAGSDSFWEKAERALLTALISYEYAINGSNGTLNNVVDMLAKMQASEQDETSMSEVDLVFEAVKEIISESDEGLHNWNNQALSALNLLRFAHAQYNTYMQGAGETKSPSSFH
ncbi:type IV secretory system conjugative DNA transfer family protein [Arcanobacterium hippocoleae]